MDDAELLAVLEPVLAADAGGGGGPESFVVLGRSGRNRSTVYFVGRAGDPAPRWVVKVPATARAQHDLTSPLPAKQQFAVMEWLYAELPKAGGEVETPRPVAYVPELDCLVMEYVDGATVASVVAGAAGRQRESVTAAMGAAASTLRVLHGLQPAEEVEVDLVEVEREAIGAARTHLQVAGLPVSEAWLQPPSVTERLVTGRRVLLHGDFVPENVLLSATDRVHCLDPDLTERDWAEQDVARFVVMLCDSPLFVTAGMTRPVRGLRHHAVRTFLQGYYGEQPVSPLLRPTMLSLVAARWRARHEDIALRGASFPAPRQALIRRHFKAFMDEVSVPSWPSPHP